MPEKAGGQNRWWRTSLDECDNVAVSRPGSAIGSFSYNQTEAHRGGGGRQAVGGEALKNAGKSSRDWWLRWSRTGAPPKHYGNSLKPVHVREQARAKQQQPE